MYPEPMKNLYSSGLIRSGLVASFTFIFATSARAADVYWNNTSLTWSTATATWNTAADGTGTTQNWNNGDNAVFSAGTALTAQYNITNGGVVVDNLTQEEGRVRLQNGTLTLADTAMVIATQTRVSGDYDIRIDSVIADSGAGASAVAKNGAGILMLTGNNTFTGGLAITNGTVAIEEQSNAFGTGTLTLNGGNLVKSFGANAVILPNAVNVIGATSIAIVNQGANNDIKFSGPFTGTGTFQVNNTAVNGLNIKNSSIKILGNISGFQGTFRDSQTTGAFNRLRFGPEAAGSFGTIDGSQAKFVLSGPTVTTGSQIDLGDAAYGTGVAAVTKVGTGTLVLAGNNTWTGITTISAGTLQIGSGGATGTLGTNGVVNNSPWRVSSPAAAVSPRVARAGPSSAA